MPSVTMEVPFASVSSAVISGCISVGKPGCGIVLSLSGFSSPVRVIRSASSNSSTSQPAARSLAVIGSMCFGITLCSVMSPFVIAAATI